MKIGIWLERGDWEAALYSLQEMAWIPSDRYHQLDRARNEIEKRLKEDSIPFANGKDDLHGG